MSWLVFALIFWAGAWALNAWLANSAWRGTRAVRILVPVLFGVSLIVLWEGLVLCHRQHGGVCHGHPD